MIVVLVLIFGLIALAAAAFVVVPLLRLRGGDAKADGRSWLALACGLCVFVVGLGSYAYLGQPQIALSTLTGPGTTDYPALVATLARAMPNRPGDRDGWTMLGRGYMALGNPGLSAKAYARAIAVAKEQDGAAPPALLTDYGEALSQEAGQVTEEAENVFKEALKEDPKDLISRYYIGAAMRQRADKAGALKLWEEVLSEAPADAPWRSSLVDEIALLKGESGGAAPNPMAMVAQLAARLESDPSDINGWVMLIRAYSVLGDRDKALAALAKAKTVFANQAPAQAMLADVTKQFSLN